MGSYAGARAKSAWRADGKCRGPQCTNTATTKGLCNTHYVGGAPDNNRDYDLHATMRLASLQVLIDTQDIGHGMKLRMRRTDPLRQLYARTPVWSM